VFSQDITSDNPIYETWRRYRLVYWKRRKGEGSGLGSKAKEYILSQFGFEVVREYYRKEKNAE